MDRGGPWRPTPPCVGAGATSQRRNRGHRQLASISEMASASLGHRGRGVWGGRVLCAGVHAYTLDYTLLLTRF